MDLSADRASLHAVIEGSTMVLTVDRPERRNALDPATLFALAGALDQARSTPAVRAVVLTGAGEQAFSSGMDLQVLASDRAGASEAIAAFESAIGSPERKPLVAAINGDAMGGGFEIALRCDLVVAARHARFGLPEARHGLLAGGGATLLPCRVPLAIALELGLTGQPIDAARAYEVGLVNRVVDHASVRSEAIRLADAIGANAPVAVAWMRRAMWAALGGVDAGRAETRLGLAAVAESEDMREGLAAFREKRRPRWSGR